jgi:hypothetical protein
LGASTQVRWLRSYSPTGTLMPTGKPMKLSTYSGIGVGKCTRAPSGKGSSTLSSTA